MNEKDKTYWKVRSTLLEKVLFVTFSEENFARVMKKLEKDLEKRLKNDKS